MKIKSAVKEAERLTKEGVPEQVEWYHLLRPASEYCPRCGMKGCKRHK